MNHNVEVFKKAFEALNHSFDTNPLHSDVPVSVRAAKIAIELIFKEAVEERNMVRAREILVEFRGVLDAIAEARI
jgi:hypothetical protein